MFLKDIITGKDNKTMDIGRVLLAAGAIGMIAMAGYKACKTGEFDAVGFGTGYGGILTGGGANLLMKAKTEPE